MNLTIRQGGLGVVLCMSLLAGALQAQEPTSPAKDEPTTERPASPESVADADEGENEPFTESVDVTVVNLEVRVRDKDGNPVRGLTRDDFRLSEDGRPVTITNFYSVEDGYRRPDDGAADASADRTLQASHAGKPDAPLYLAIYVDNFNIRPFNRNRVFRRLRDFVHAQLGDDDVVMLVSYERALHVRAPFSTNRNQLLAKLDELERFTGHAVTTDADRRQVMREIDEADSESYAKVAAETFAQSVFSDLRFSIRAMHDFVEQMAGIRGRRAILHVSDGMPMRAAESVFYALERKYSTSAINLTTLDFDATREFRSLASAAASNGITLYMLDAAGLRVGSGAGVQASRSPVGSSSMVDSVYIRNHQQPLRFLAEETGGFAIVNTNDVGPSLERMRQDLDDYYSLGYAPAGTFSGRGHRLEVEIPGRKKLTVRYRQSYREQTLAERMEDETLAALRFGMQDNPFGATLQLADVRPVDDGLFDVTAWLYIPVGELTLVPGEGTHRGRVSLYVSALDEEGGVSDVANLDVPIELPNEDMDELRGLDFPYRLALRMRAGPHRVAVGIRDELGARSSYLSHEFTVGANE